MDANEAGRAILALPEVSPGPTAEEIKPSPPGCDALEQSSCLCGYRAVSAVRPSGAPCLPSFLSLKQPIEREA